MFGCCCTDQTPTNPNAQLVVVSLPSVATEIGIRVDMVGFSDADAGNHLLEEYDYWASAKRQNSNFDALAETCQYLKQNYQQPSQAFCYLNSDAAVISYAKRDLIGYCMYHDCFTSAGTKVFQPTEEQIGCRYINGAMIVNQKLSQSVECGIEVI